jgi:hypothetical protein
MDPRDRGGGGIRRGEGGGGEGEGGFLPVAFKLVYKCIDLHKHSDKCKTSGFTTARLECGFTTCSEQTSDTTMLYSTSIMLWT